MAKTGYSDRINHALAFAAKHHDRQVRKGLRLPYITRFANVAIILTRYGCDDHTVVGGILHDVVEDWVLDRYTPEMLAQRIGDKFGDEAMQTALTASKRMADDDGIDLSHDESRDDFLVRLGNVSDSARWVSAAGELHDASTLLADLRRTIDPDTVWARRSMGKHETVQWYRRFTDRLTEAGFAGAILDELSDVVRSLEQWLGPTAPRPVADALGQP